MKIQNDKNNEPVFCKKFHLAVIKGIPEFPIILLKSGATYGKSFEIYLLSHRILDESWKWLQVTLSKKEFKKNGLVLKDGQIC